jgi:hypothetical protein
MLAYLCSCSGQRRPRKSITTKPFSTVADRNGHWLSQVHWASVSRMPLRGKYSIRKGGSQIDQLQQ